MGADSFLKGCVVVVPCLTLQVLSNACLELPLDIDSIKSSIHIFNPDYPIDPSALTSKHTKIAFRDANVDCWLDVC